MIWYWSLLFSIQNHLWWDLHRWPRRYCWLGFYYYSLPFYLIMSVGTCTVIDVFAGLVLIVKKSFFTRHGPFYCGVIIFGVSLTHDFFFAYLFVVVFLFINELIEGERYLWVMWQHLQHCFILQMFCVLYIRGCWVYRLL